LRLDTSAAIKLLSTSLVFHFKRRRLKRPVIYCGYTQRARSDQDNQLLWHTERNSRQQKLNQIEYMSWQH